MVDEGLLLLDEDVVVAGGFSGVVEGGFGTGVEDGLLEVDIRVLTVDGDVEEGDGSVEGGDDPPVIRFLIARS